MCGYHESKEAWSSGLASLIWGYIKTGLHCWLGRYSLEASLYVDLHVECWSHSGLGWLCVAMPKPLKRNDNV